MELRLANQSSIIVAGASGSGKSTLITGLLRQPEKTFREPIETIYWYSTYQVPLEQRLPGAVYEVGLPNKFSEKLKRCDAVVVDDMMGLTDKNQELTDMFTKGCHHTHCTLIYITQNLYDSSRGKTDNRTRSLNADYIFVFRNIRDNTQIVTLSYQMFPTNSGFLRDTFQEVTASKPYSYLLLDFRQESPDLIRVRTNILPHEYPPAIYVNNKHVNLVHKQLELQLTLL